MKPILLDVKQEMLESPFSNSNCESALRQRTTSLTRYTYTNSANYLGFIPVDSSDSMKMSDT